MANEPAPVRCPKCRNPRRKLLRWVHIEVHGAGGVRVPEKEWYTVECPCGWFSTKRVTLQANLFEDA